MKLDQVKDGKSTYVGRGLGTMNLIFHYEQSIDDSQMENSRNSNVSMAISHTELSTKKS